MEHFPYIREGSTDSASTNLRRGRSPHVSHFYVRIFQLGTSKFWLAFAMFGKRSRELI